MASAKTKSNPKESAGASAGAPKQKKSPPSPKSAPKPAGKSKEGVSKASKASQKKPVSKGSTAAKKPSGPKGPPASPPPKKKPQAPTSAAPQKNRPKAASSAPQPSQPQRKEKSAQKREEKRKRKEQQLRHAADRRQLEQQLAQEDSQAYQRLLHRRSVWKRKKRKQTYILLLVLLVAVGFFLCCRMFLTISTVQVSGQSRYTDDDLILSSGLKIGDNLYDFEPAQVAQKILDGHIYLESVEAHRVLPTTVEIVVTPVLETGVVKGEIGFSIISTGGKVLETGIPYPPSELPIIVGLQLNVSRADNAELANVMDKRLEILSDINRALTENKMTGITQIDLSDTMSLTITYQDRVKINLGDKDNLNDKVRLSVRILEEVGDIQEGVLNLSIDKKGFFRNESIHTEFIPVLPASSEPEEGENSGQPEEGGGGESGESSEAPSSSGAETSN